MSKSSRLSLMKSRSQNFGFASPQNSQRSRNMLKSLPRSPKSPIWNTSSTRTMTAGEDLKNSNLLKISSIPLASMFRKTSNFHSGTILPEHLYHPPKSNACMPEAPSYSIPRTK